MKRRLAIVSAVLALFLAPHASAFAACSNPAGTAGEVIYSDTQKIIQYCDDANWVRMNRTPGSGSGGCAGPAAAEGEMIYNSDFRVMQVCAGNVWRAVGPVGGGSNNKWARINSGRIHNCGIKNDGTLWCWGRGEFGRLGNGSESYHYTPGQTSAGGAWSRVAPGGNHTCGIKADGTLWCWGRNADGQLGDGTTTQQLDPVQESSASTWKEVSAGGNHTCAIKSDDTLWCWGDDTNGQLGNGAGTTADQPDPVQESSASAWKAVSAGNSFTCAIKTDDTLWCWGKDSDGQLGNGGASADASDPTQESTAGTWKAVSAGNIHACGIKTDDTARCWGDDSSGQIGNGSGSSADQQSPVALSGGGTWLSIAAGNLHSCGVKTNGTLWCWGSDTNGQVGNGATTGDRVSPVQESTGGTAWTSVTIGNQGDTSCGLRSDGLTLCWGSGGGNGMQGDNGEAVGGQARNDAPELPVVGGSVWKAITTGHAHSCGIRNDGTLWCWGSDGSGVLGNGGGRLPPPRQRRCRYPAAARG